MILFQDNTEKTEMATAPSLDSFKGIKAAESPYTEKVRDFWDKLFERKDTYTPDENENLLPEIFGRSSDEFKFDFTINQELRDYLDKFAPQRWEQLSIDDKLQNINEFSETLADKLNLKEPPAIFLFPGPEGSYGAYNPTTNTVTINHSLLSDPVELVDTIAHETWHAYQHQRANMMENKQDYLYKLNFSNYISPQALGDGKYLFFPDYQEQLVEAEARAFASIFREGVVI